MKIILSKSNYENNYQNVIGRAETKNIIIYFNKDIDSAKKENSINRRLKYVPEIKYTEYAILQNTSKMRGKIIFLSDYDKFTFDSLDNLENFIETLLKIAQFNIIQGFSTVHNYVKLYNKTKLNETLWSELIRKLKYDATFKEFCIYLKELEDNQLYINIYGFYTFMLYELVYRARNTVLQLQ